MRLLLLLPAALMLAAVSPMPAAAQYSRSPRAITFDPSLQLDTTRIVFAPGGLGSIEVTAGTGEPARAGQSVTVHYIGRLAATGRQFDSSRDRNEPFKFTLGAAEVIRGWDLGVAGMRKGERRLLIVPPALGYGNAGAPPDIPPAATLVFDVELPEIQ